MYLFVYTVVYTNTKFIYIHVVYHPDAICIYVLYKHFK